MKEENLRKEWKEFNGDQAGDEIIADWWINKFTEKLSSIEREVEAVRDISIPNGSYEQGDKDGWNEALDTTLSIINKHKNK